MRDNHRVHFPRGSASGGDHAGEAGTPATACVNLDYHERQARSMPVFGFLLGMILACSVGFSRLHQLRFLKRERMLPHAYASESAPQERSHQGNKRDGEEIYPKGSGLEQKGTTRGLGREEGQRGKDGEDTQLHLDLSSR